LTAFAFRRFLAVGFAGSPRVFRAAAASSAVGSFPVMLRAICYWFREPPRHRPATLLDVMWFGVLFTVALGSITLESMRSALCAMRA